MNLVVNSLNLCISEVEPQVNCISTDDFKIEDVRNRLNDKVCERIQVISEDNKRRLEGYKNNIQFLSKGVFYPHEYFYALKEKKQIKRIDELKKTDSFFHGYVSPKYFDIERDAQSPTGKKTGSFILKEGVPPSEALEKMVEGLSLIGCGEVCQAVQYESIKEILGIQKFNALFASNSSTPLMIGSRLSNNPIHRIRLYLKNENPSEIKRGDLVYFQNTDLYSTKHLRGAAAGFNTLCIDDTKGSQKFTSLGLSAEGINPDEINNALMREFNAIPSNLEFLSEKTKATFFRICGINHEIEEKLKEVQDLEIDLKDFQKFNGGKCILICKLDAKKVTALANSSIQKARILLDQWEI